MREADEPDAGLKAAGDRRQEPRAQTETIAPADAAGMMGFGVSPPPPESITVDAPDQLRTAPKVCQTAPSTLFGFDAVAVAPINRKRTCANGRCSTGRQRGADR
jgi:hypothetical protein